MHRAKENGSYLVCAPSYSMRAQSPRAYALTRLLWCGYKTQQRQLQFVYTYGPTARQRLAFTVITDRIRKNSGLFSERPRFSGFQQRTRCEPGVNATKYRKQATSQGCHPCPRRYDPRARLRPSDVVASASHPCSLARSPSPEGSTRALTVGKDGTVHCVGSF